MNKRPKKKTARRTRPTGRAQPARRDTLSILFTCVGRRIELLEAFRRAASRLRVTLTIYGADINQVAPAIHRVDKPYIVPRIDNRRHIPELLRIVQREKIDLIIPLIDSDLLALCRAADRFKRLGCTVLISDENVIRACADKLATYRTLAQAGIDTPRTWSAREATAIRRHKFPYFVKPRTGSAGVGLYRVNTTEELRVFLKRGPESIVQEFVPGVEHTLDVYAGFDGTPRCVVPRRRIEVRTGEVSKGIIVKDPAIIEVGRCVVRALGGCRGVITVQCIVTSQGRIRVIEVNPRFGGGAPLSIQAGADFPRWIMAQLLNRRVRISDAVYKDRLTMLRYDESVFINGDHVLPDD